MASAAKAAAFAAMLRVLLQALPHWSADYQPIIWVLAALTVVGGSLMAVVQTNVKRMLAFSSISHAGFMLVGVEAAVHQAGAVGPNDGRSSVLLYTLIYAVLVIGTFAVVTAVGRTGDGATDLASFRGLGRARPALALGMTVLLLAQAGVPLTSGFVAKFGIIRAAVEQHSYAIAIIAMVAAVIAAFLYLRIMVSMWISEPEAGDEARETVRTPALLAVAVSLSVAFTLAVGFFPNWLIHLAP
jgi:NADH-quinone oxidoreductase subunit N